MLITDDGAVAVRLLYLWWKEGGGTSRGMGLAAFVDHHSLHIDALLALVRATSHTMGPVSLPRAQTRYRVFR